MLLGAVIDRVTKKRKTVEIERERETVLALRSYLGTLAMFFMLLLLRGKVFAFLI
jgi:hypothetical protein